MAALEANREWLQAKVSINNALVTEATAHHRANATTARRFLPRRRVRGPEDLNRRRAKNAAGPDAGDGGEHKDHEALVAALRASREWLEGKVIASSAVLLRGFDVRDAVEFDAVVEALGWPDIRYIGSAPRTHVHGRVWTANEGPLEQQFVYFHHEMVLIKEFPEKVILFCEEFPEMVEELDAKGLRYTLTALSRNDNRSMRGRGWEDAFGTSDKAEAENRAKALGMDVEWLPDGSAKTILGRRRLTRVFPGPRGPQDVVQHGGGDARQGGELCHGGRRQRDPGELCSADRGDHRGGEHPVPVAEGRHPHPRQPRHAPRAPAVVAA